MGESAEEINLEEYRRLAALENAIKAAPILRTVSRQEILRDAQIFEDYLKDGSIPTP